MNGQRKNSVGLVEQGSDVFVYFFAYVESIISW